MTEMNIFNVQRTITQKVSKSDLQFSFSAHPLMVLHMFVKLTSITETVIFNVQRPITQKVLNQTWFLCSTCDLMLLYIFARLQEKL